MTIGGNLLQKNVTQGTAENLQVTVDAHNHVTSPAFTYDTAGDLTWDTFNLMKYDAENRATPTTGGTYLYDGDGHRVKKVSGSSTYYYWFDDNFDVLATTGANVRDYVYFNGSRIAFFAGTLPYFYVKDNLGSASVIANGDDSAIEWESDYFPFGGQRVITNSITNYFSFTGYQYDSGTGYYYAENRIQSPNLGRFMSPDPDAGDLVNPQSLNRYAYVGNNPTNNIDPHGDRILPHGSRAGDYEDDFGPGVSAASMYVSAASAASYFNGSTIDGLDAPTSMVQATLSSGGGVQCPNNNCGLGSPTPYQCLGNNCGYMTIQYVTSHEYECAGGMPCTSQEHQQYVLKIQQQAMQSQRSAIVRALQKALCPQHDSNCLKMVDSEVTVDKSVGKDGLIGGHWNFQLGNDLLPDLSRCPESRCGAFPSFHFAYANDVHIDEANPFAFPPLGLAGHVFFDVIGGHTIWRNGFPH